MLLYSNKSYWRIMLEPKGSLVLHPKNIFLGFLISLVTWMISYFRTSSTFMGWYRFISPVNNVGWNMMGATIVFAVVFRTNLGWQRYWEALGQLQMMYSKWADAFTQCLGFANVTLTQLQASGLDDADEQLVFLRDKLGNLQKNFSLLSALSAHRLLHADCYRMHQRSKMGSWSDQVILRRTLRVDRDLTGATMLPGFVKVENRTQLNANLDNTWSGDYCVTEVPNEEETKLLEETSDRVHSVMYWIVHDLAEIAPKLATPPPIQARMYQELSNGMLGFQHAVKVADTPFPFQFAQLFNFLIIAFSFFIPIYASTFTESTFLSPVIAYVVHQSVLVINQVALQLETPFGTDYNDISIKDYHARFLEAIIEVNPMSKYKANDTLMQIESVKPRAAAPPGALARKAKRPATKIVETLGSRDRDVELSPEPNQGSPSPGSWSLLPVLNHILQDIRDLDARGNLGTLIHGQSGLINAHTHDIPQRANTVSGLRPSEESRQSPRFSEETAVQMIRTEDRSAATAVDRQEDFQKTGNQDSNTSAFQAVDNGRRFSISKQPCGDAANENHGSVWTV